LARFGLQASAVALALSVAQVVAVRWLDPPFTLTMIERALEPVWTGGAPRWPTADPVRLDELGAVVPRAVVASEDARFFLHQGFDATAICAALRSNEAGGRLRGGSTLTQQVAKNVFLWQHRSWVRKGLEAWYTALLELLVPKSRILELYLNVAETGPFVFGVEAGARHHFGRSAASLTPEQAGRLAGILPDPRRRSVTGTAAAARARFVAEYPAPFPGDRSFDLVAASFAAEPGWRACLR
jgi:monofunctional biosynthetic peptidoglycan transglycosylase